MSTRRDAASPVRELVCHCRSVTYDEVSRALDAGAQTLADIQRTTTACTRCFGCRFELERMRQDRLGSRYERTDLVTLPALEAPAGTEARFRPGLLGRFRPKIPPKYALEFPVQRMYMPAFVGFAGSDVETRVVLFNLPAESADEGVPTAVPVRVDLLGLDGTRVSVLRTTVGPGRSVVLNVADMEGADRLEGGVGVLKTIIQSESISSLRPYFQLETPGGITSTHEKKAGRKPSRTRTYHWMFQIAPVPEDAYFFLTNTQPTPLQGNELVWQGDGPEVRVPLPGLELDQSACVPLHEHVPAIAEGRATGTWRLEPSVHVAGFQLRHDRRRDLWRVQHL